MEEGDWQERPLSEREAAILKNNNNRDKIVFGGKPINLRDSTGSDSWKSHSWPPPGSEDSDASDDDEGHKKGRKRKGKKKREVSKSEDAIDDPDRGRVKQNDQEKHSKVQLKGGSGGSYSLPPLVHLLEQRAKSSPSLEVGGGMEEPDLKMIKELVAREGKKALSQVIKSNGQTVVHVAVDKGNYKLLKYALKEGADPNLKDSKGYTPLHLACADGACDMVTLLLQKGKDVHISAKARDGSTPLHLLVHHGPKATLPQIRRQLDFDLDEYRGEEKDSSGIFSNSRKKRKEGDKEKNKGKGSKRKRRISNYFQAVNLLVNSGCDPMSRDNNGDTCMHLAAREGRIAVVEYLVEILGFRMDINATNK